MSATRLPAILSLALCCSSSVALAGAEVDLVDTGVFVNVETEADLPSGFLELIGMGMAEQSFTLQHHGVAGSAALPGIPGLQLGVQIKTFPLTGSVENLVGKEEKTTFIPVLPELEVGYGGGEGPWRWRIGFGGVPPLSVKGASALTLGADASVAYELHPKVNLGLEVSYTLGRALAPVTAGADITADDVAPAQTATIERLEEVCHAQEFGCIDTLFFSHLAPSLVVALPVTKVAQPYAKVGLVQLVETFDVQVDLTAWKVTGVLPTFAVGTGLSLHEHLRAALGLAAAYRPESLSDPQRVDGAGLFWRIEAGAVWVF